MRTIDIDEAIDRYYAEWKKQDICDGSEDRNWLMKCLDEAPTIDAVPVIRCKNCKHRRDYASGHYCAKRPNNGGYFCEDTDFCSYGERKE